MKLFPHEEGYVDVLNGHYHYVYNYTDHLGNIRLSYSDANEDNMVDNSEILEENNYYPFGLKHTAYNTNEQQYIKDEILNQIILDDLPKYEGDGSFQRKYNGKEWQDELSLNVYDYGARNYDPALGRWMNIDPLAERFAPTSPFVYVFNNPLKFIDPNGKEGVVVSGQPGEHKNREHFLVNGLDRAKSALGRRQSKSEKVTWLVYNDGSESYGYTKAEIKKYEKLAKKAGIEMKVVDEVDKIVDYVNEKTGGDSRKNDKITSFYYVGHATPGDLDAGYTDGLGGEDFDPSDFNSEAFASGAWINVVAACQTAVSGFFESSVVDQFTEIVDSQSTVNGSSVRTQFDGGVRTDSQLLKENNGEIVTKKGEND